MQKNISVLIVFRYIWLAIDRDTHEIVGCYIGDRTRKSAHKLWATAAAEECEREMFVDIDWEGEALAVPLHQLEPNADTDEDTQQVVEDWHYWVNRGYQLA